MKKQLFEKIEYLNEAEWKLLKLAIETTQDGETFTYSQLMDNLRILIDEIYIGMVLRKFLRSDAAAVAYFLKNFCERDNTVKLPRWRVTEEVSQTVNPDYD